MRNKFSKLVFTAAFGLALAFILSCSSDDNANENRSNINSGTEISSSGGGGGSSSPSSNGNGSGSSSSGNSSGSLSSIGSNGSSSSSSGGGNNGSSSSGNFSSSSLGQSSSAVLKECDAIFNPDNKFCYDGIVYDKCGGKVYSPASEICQYGQVTTAKCNGGDNYNPITQICCGSIAILSNSTTERCTSSIVEIKCGSIWYNQTPQFCYNDIVYDKCGGNSYNPSTQGCVNSKVVETKCGSGWYDQATQFCYDNRIYAKCDGMVYTPSTHICQNGVATPAKCGNESYNPLTQFCGNSTVKNYGTPLTDARDGAKYKTTVIGTQTWMAENLNYNASGSKCYDNNEGNCTKYGRLYNWATAKTACPSGWHLPSDAEWDVLVNYAGGSSIAGKKLKATSSWYDGGNGQDTYGFSALPGGYGYSNGDFNGVGNYGNWWSSSEYGANDAYYRGMYYNYEGVFRDNYYKTNLLSVRCLQD